MSKNFKDFIKKCKNSILFYTLAYAIVFIGFKFILDKIGIAYRQYFNYFSIILIFVGIIVSLIQLFIKSKSKNKKICMAICIVSILALVLICSPIILLFIAFIPREHVIIKNNKKYVAYVYSWTDTRVDYHEYINFLLVGKNTRIKDFYNDVGRDVLAEDAKGLFTPTDTTYYDKNGKYEYSESEKNTKVTQNKTSNNIIENTNQEYNKEQKENIISNDILYKKEINKNTIIRIKNYGAVLAQRSIIAIEKSTDGGKTYKNQLETSDGLMQIHNGTEFVFIDENIGFINDPGLAGTNGENRELLITTDGGKSFKNTTIVHPSNIKENNLFVKGVPYIKDGKLKVQIYTVNYSKEPAETYYEFTSEDNGITWRYIGSV